MLNSKLMHVRDKAPEGGGGGGFPTPPQSAQQQPPAEKPPEAPKDGDKFDALGYEKTPEAAPPAKEGAAQKPGDKPPEAPTPPPEKVENPATGYGAEPPKVEEPPAAPEPPTAPPTDTDKLLEGLPPTEIAKIKDFIGKTKVEGDVLKAFAELRKQEFAEAKTMAAQMEKQAEIEKSKIRAAWHDELRKDATFGGDKFQLNISRAEKVLDQFMTHTKKVLTERGSMLPPYVMRDLAKLADHLFATPTLPQGDPPAPAESESKKDDPLAFYE